ncbi:hypothetical protein HanRHA438_Chr10g0447831 [Helianthus annuus]|uniref:Uncharacterized protein n=1 Tax=Helianthus annuus TaxID=4232 RepID=A0A9K3N3J4_HELAN|nr:hypothetical protein HanXRQr2_Chr10g0435671 [Helianthus annuus]KAJ0513488.1 hypothetical protein HanHA300_Chr10g0358161 [Helianthus annuus]KAJ0521341.1 hypothetical protein HanIR_Chr10g0469731 [Helianthus annuus]KAJ0529598.1 hypothetical protein HanHA89_Chr10g0379711 [Helianthus annuus]KAJ0696483.1 hypothetical protein HanLR1_Chr10g0357621 [Helianthus annuus]
MFSCSSLLILRLLILLLIRYGCCGLIYFRVLMWFLIVLEATLFSV